MRTLTLIAIFFTSVACQAATAPMPKAGKPMSTQNLETATLAAGCFWCTEAVFQRLKGVSSARSGYIGGTVKNPSYEQVCTGTTGHAEAIEVTFDPKVISYEELLTVFFKTHDPTTLNRQGHDSGTQYRSGIFTHSEAQTKAANQMKQKAAAWWESPIVTEITPAGVFYPAEDYHQNYYNQNTQQGYCRAVINPKLIKFRKEFASKLKPE